MTVATETRVAELVKAYAGRPSELIQALHRVQSELGHVPYEAQAVVAAVVGVPLSQVRGVVTFYHFFRTSPVGRHTLRLCLGTACHVRGRRTSSRRSARSWAWAWGKLPPTARSPWKGCAAWGHVASPR